MISPVVAAVWNWELNTVEVYTTDGAVFVRGEWGWQECDPIPGTPAAQEDRPGPRRAAKGENLSVPFPEENGGKAARLIQTGDVCRMLKLSPPSVDRLEELGALRPLRTQGGVRRFYRSEVEALADRYPADSTHAFLKSIENDKKR